MSRLLMMGLLFTVAASVLGCDSSVEGYRTFTFNKVAHFSFEYPAHYEKRAASANVENKTIFIGFGDKVPSKGIDDGFIMIRVEGAGDTYPDATAALEHTLSGFFEPEPYEEYEYEPKRLLESSSITIDGIPAELIVYSYGWDFIQEESSGLVVILMRITREVYFDYNGFIWKIVIESDEDKAEVAEADFEHLLETFEILD